MMYKCTALAFFTQQVTNHLVTHITILGADFSKNVVFESNETKQQLKSAVNIFILKIYKKHDT